MKQTNFHDSGQRPMQRIALLMGAGTIYGRAITLGISLYARPTKPWIFNTAPPEASSIKQLKKWNPSGVIAHASRQQVVAELKQLDVPVVNVSNILGEKAPFPRVGPDDHRVGQLAAEHFIERGFKHYAFCSVKHWQFAQHRLTGFQSRLANQGFSVNVFEYPSDAIIDTAGDIWGTEAGELVNWVNNLPKPVAIFAAGDVLAFALSEVCSAAGIHIPEQVALLGVDNDQVACELAYPRLSSVDLAPRRIGYEAAKLLDELLNGKPAPDRPILLPPSGVFVRHSSDITAIDDKYIAMALRFIREHADQNIGVKDVLGAVPVSRRDLERRFRRQLDRTVLEEIRRAHIAQAKKLLAEESFSIEQVAERSGFSSLARFSTVFKEMTNQTPSTYHTQFNKSH